MEIILLKDVEKVGDKHEVVTVKDGYGRNFLIPQGMALVANTANRNKLANMMRQTEARDNKMLDQYRVLAQKLQGMTLRIGAKAGTTGKIFGSVTNVQIAAELKNQLGIEIERKKVVITDKVEEVGTYSADVNFHKEVQGKVSFEVVAE